MTAQAAYERYNEALAARRSTQGRERQQANLLVAHRRTAWLATIRANVRAGVS